MLLFVNQLCNVDFSYLHPERGLVGETWIANIELDGALDAQGMVCDFARVKSFMREWLDTNIDHKLLVPAQAENLTLTQSTEKQQDQYRWQLPQGEISGSGPQQAHCVVPSPVISEHTVADWAIEQIKQHFPETISQLRLSFEVEPIAGPYYHYSHGLKKHGGNCQRIAHGHRSKIEIWKNGELDTALMQAQSESWRDIYIGTRSDLVEAETTLDNYHFEYEAEQGSFSLSIPKDHCHLIDSDSTVEFIAKHIAETLKSIDSASTFRVKAYEGLAKGAIATS